MKKILLLFTVLLGLTLSANAETYTYTFTSKQFSANGTKTLNEVDWTLAGDGNYWGYDGTKGQQFGSGSKPYKSMTLSTSEVPGTITSVTINTSGGSSTKAKLTVSVGGTQFGNQVSLTASATDYTFEGNAAGELVLSYTQTSSKAIYIKSISVTYSVGGSGEPETPTLAAPSFSQEDGYEFSSPFELTIEQAEDAVIWYSVNEGEYEEYTGAITISETTTVSAYATAEGYNDSEEVTATYYYSDPNAVEKTIVFKASAVTEPEGGFSFPNEVLVNDAGYDFNGFNVKFGSSSTKTQDYGSAVRYYAGASMTITPSEGRTIKRVELNVVDKDGTISSKVGTCSGAAGANQVWKGRTTDALVLTADAQIRFSYMTITYEESENAIQTLAAPAFSQEDGYEFSSPFELTITAEEGATVYYTLDGTDPTAESDVYSAPIEIAETMTVKAYAVKAGYNDSPITEATYTYIDLSSADKYGLVTSTDQLVAGVNYLIAYDKYAMGAVSGTYFSKTELKTIDNVNKIISITTESVNPVSLEGEEGAWGFKTSEEDKYLYWNSGNTLNTYDTLLEGAVNGTKWTVYIDETGTKIQSNHSSSTGTSTRFLSYNVSSPRFACYTGTQANPSLYAELKYIYINDQTPAGDVVIVSIVNENGEAVTYSALETGEWAVTRAADSFNKRYGYVPGNSSYTITYQYTKNEELVTETREFTPNADGYIAFNGDTITSIGGIEVENAPVEYFNLQGVRVANPENGLFIRRQGNKVEKVIVK